MVNAQDQDHWCYVAEDFRKLRKRLKISSYPERYLRGGVFKTNSTVTGERDIKEK